MNEEQRERPHKVTCEQLTMASTGLGRLLGKILGTSIFMALLVSFVLHSLVNEYFDGAVRKSLELMMDMPQNKTASKNNNNSHRNSVLLKVSKSEKLLPSEKMIAAHDNNNNPKKENQNNPQFDHVWKDLKNKLCPNMAPNVHLGPTIFSLARSEIGLNKFKMPLSMMKSHHQASNITFDDHSNGEKEEDLDLEQQWKNGSSFFTAFFQRVKHGFVYTPPSTTTTIANHNDNNDHKQQYQSVCYLAIWKAANDQIRKGTEKLLQNETGLFKKAYSHKMDSSCCVVTAVRDPISHFLSAYNEEEYRHWDSLFMAKKHANMLAKKHANMLARRPRYKYGEWETAAYAQYEHGSIERFEQFVIDFLSGPYVSRGAYTHTHSMVGILDWLHQKNFQLTDYLPSLDNLLERWPQFMHETCGSTVVPDFFQTTPLDTIRAHPSTKDPYGFYKAAKKVWSLQEHTAKALCALHIMDYACYEKLPKGVPPLCQEVYSNPHFVQTLLKGQH